MASAVVVTDLVKRFPKTVGYRHILPWVHGEEVTALAGISLEVAEGELFGLLGPNGAGKTTLMKILSTLVLPNSGRATIFGHDVVAEESEARRMVGLITADERSFYWRLTGRQNLLFFAALYELPRREAETRVTELLEMLGLAEAAGQRFQTYSTGMRQKMAIARGLLANPRMLLVDEPTRSLDPISAQTVRDFLKEKISRTGCTIILATHQMSEAEQLCDRVAILDRGRVLALGAIPELRLGRRRDRCHLEVGGLDGRWKALERIPGVTGIVVLGKHDDVTALDVGLAASREVLPKLIESVVSLGGSIRDCRVEERPLEEIFVELVRDASGASGRAGSVEPAAEGALLAC
ncbi:MAG: ABC transporter ATP-binding protein [Actinobacteria bacterium]|nr:ABC transporter ATP-binding protein [Actinomycetota bacterium]